MRTVVRSIFAALLPLAAAACVAGSPSDGERQAESWNPYWPVWTPTGIVPNASFKPIGPFSGGPTSDPILVGSGGGRMEAFERGGENHVWWAHYDPTSGTWARFQDLGGPNGSVSPNSEISAVGDRLGHYGVFALSVDRRVYANFTYDRVNWSGWQLVDAAQGSQPIAVMDSSMHVWVFRSRVIGNAAEMDFRKGMIEFPVDAWDDWGTFGDQATPISASANSAGKVDVLAYAEGRPDGKDGLHQREVDAASGAWTDWHYLGNPGLEFVANAVIVSSDVARIDVLTIANDQSIRHLWGTGATIDSGWQNLGGVAFSSRWPSRFPGLRAVSWGNSVVEVFVEGTDYGLFRNELSGAWSGWQPVAPCMMFGSRVGAIAPAVGDVELVFPSIDGGVYGQSLTTTPSMAVGAHPTASCPSGGVGQLCSGAPNPCNGSVCDMAGFPDTNATPHCTGCGGEGQWCCTSGAQCGGGMQCHGEAGGARCRACGGKGAACCGGSACDAGLACENGTCESCGGLGQPCCNGGGCGSNLACLGGTCQTASCGHAGERCCDGGCANQNLECDKGTCEPCGLAGEKCCTLNKWYCPGPVQGVNSDSIQCRNDQCVPSGQTSTTCSGAVAAKGAKDYAIGVVEPSGCAAGVFMFYANSSNEAQQCAKTAYPGSTTVTSGNIAWYDFAQYSPYETCNTFQAPAFSQSQAAACAKYYCQNCNVVPNACP